MTEPEESLGKIYYSDGGGNTQKFGQRKKVNKKVNRKGLHGEGVVALLKGKEKRGHLRRGETYGKRRL